MFSSSERKAAPSRRTPKAAATRYQGRTRLKTVIFGWLVVSDFIKTVCRSQAQPDRLRYLFPRVSPRRGSTCQILNLPLPTQHPLARIVPAAQNNFVFRIELEPFRSLNMQIAEK